MNLLTMTGHEWAATVILMVGAVINITACAVGIALFGAMGAAVATATINVAWNAAMGIYLYKRVNMLPGLVYAVAQFRRRGRGQET